MISQLEWSLRLTSYITLIPLIPLCVFFFFTAPPPPHIYTLSLHDLFRSLPAGTRSWACPSVPPTPTPAPGSTSSTARTRSEEHTSELQSRFDLVCRLLLEKKKLSTICLLVLPELKLYF